MNIDYMYRFLQFMSRKNQTGQITPDEAMFAINSASRNRYLEYIGIVEQFKPGKPVPNVALGMNSRIAESLTPFKKTSDPITLVNQIAEYPEDFERLSILTDESNKRIERIDDTELPSRLNSKIDPIGDGFRPCYTEEATGWKVWPDGLQNVIAIYYRLPVDGLWAFTLNGDGRPVYDPDNSIDLEWNDTDCQFILGIAAKYLGFSFTAENLVQYGVEVKSTGT